MRFASGSPDTGQKDPFSDPPAEPGRDGYHRRPLHPDSTREVLKHLHRLWGFTVRLEAVDENGKVELVGECPARR
jgi:hypothetical protein